MDMTGEYRIPAPRQTVWEALNDPAVLKASIPGCEELVKKSDTELEAKVTAKVGPVKAKFGGNVTLSDLNPPESYTISGQGSGGAAGFAKGGASVRLTEDGSDTILRYEAKADVGGKLAQIGSRLIQGTAKKMADEFFGTFSRIVAAEAAGARGVAAEAAAVAAPPAVEPAPVIHPRPEPVGDAVAAAAAEVRPIEPEPAAAPVRPAEPAPPRVAEPAPARPAEPAAPRFRLPALDRGGLVQSPWVWLAGIILFLAILFVIFL